MATAMEPSGVLLAASSDAATRWHWLEAQIRLVMHRYGYQEVRLPVLEPAADKEGEAMPATLLRPDGQPSCLPMLLALHPPARRSSTRLWYLGPVLWHDAEGPQQHVQFGIETFGVAGPEMEVELVLLTRDLLAALHLESQCALQLASLGSWHEQTTPHRRLGLASRRHFATLTRLLDGLSLPFGLPPQPLPGAGYFSQCALAWHWHHAPHRPGLCLGGRCDDLASRLAGHPLTAVGVSWDVTTLLASLEPLPLTPAHATPLVSLRTESRELATELVLLGQSLRVQLPGYHVRTLLSGMAPDDVPDPVDWRLTLRQDGRLQVWGRRQGSLDDLAVPSVVALLHDLRAGKG